MIGSSLAWKQRSYGQELGLTLSPTVKCLNNHSSLVKVSRGHQMAERSWAMSWTFQYTSFQIAARGEGSIKHPYLQGLELSPGKLDKKLLLCDSDFTILGS